MTMIEKVLKNKEAVKRVLQDEREKLHNMYCNYYALYCKYYALYDLCHEISVFGYSKEAEERLIELVRKEALEK